MNQLAETAQLVDVLIDRLDSSYVFPERSAAAAELLRANLAGGRYDLPIGPTLCELLSDDLLEACNDKHLRLIWHESLEVSQDEEQLVAELRQLMRRENHGLRRVERLPGNVGLIELTLIPDAASAGPAFAAAMQLVVHTHALILDLRNGRGGAPDGVAFLASFFFADGETHLSDIVEGPDGPTRQYWTSSFLPAPRYLDRPVYAVTSATTFSGAEGLAYDLQALKRATVVGEVTRGGAHPSEVVSLREHVELRLPVARGVSAVTGGNWEGTGVQPDVVVSAETAVDVALQTALEAIAHDETLPEAGRAEAAARLRHAAD
jgi:C-terminal processing protease CtpA/Prc